MEDGIGRIVRIDTVRMPGNPKKGGQYWCAVVHFNSVSQEACRILSSGNCVRYGRVVRVQLFRGDTQSEGTIRAKQAAQTASIQCAKALNVVSNVAKAMDNLLISVM